MKKLLVILSFLFLSLFSFAQSNTYPTTGTASMAGLWIFNPLYTGGFGINYTATGVTQFSCYGLGIMMQFGPGNSIDLQGNALVANGFQSTFSSVKLTGGSPGPGKVLTGTDALGNNVWSVPLSLGAGVNITSVTLISNIAAGDLNPPIFATWSQSGKVVDLELYGTTRHVNNGVLTQFKFTLPASIPPIAQGIFGQGTVRVQLNVANHLIPMFAFLSTPTAQEVTVRYWPLVGGGTTLEDFVIRTRYVTP